MRTETTLIRLFMLAAGGFHSVAVLGWGFLRRSMFRPGLHCQMQVEKSDVTTAMIAHLTTRTS